MSTNKSRWLPEEDLLIMLIASTIVTPEYLYHNHDLVKLDMRLSHSYLS